MGDYSVCVHASASVLIEREREKEGEGRKEERQKGRQLFSGLNGHLSLSLYCPCNSSGKDPQ